jgi:hypothetical protein
VERAFLHRLLALNNWEDCERKMDQLPLAGQWRAEQLLRPVLEIRNAALLSRAVKHVSLFRCYSIGMLTSVMSIIIYLTLSKIIIMYLSLSNIIIIYVYFILSKIVIIYLNLSKTIMYPRK